MTHSKYLLSLILSLCWASASMAQSALDLRLLKAVRNNQLQEVQQLIAQGADVNVKGGTYKEDTPLHIVDDLEIAKLLIENGADVNAKNEVKFTPLLSALIHSKNTEVAKLLIESGADINTKSDLGGYTPLLEASGFQENAEMAKFLINKGAEVNVKDDNGCTPLYFASTYNGNLELVRLLLDKGADVTLKNKDGQTPLHGVRSVEIAKLLIDKGAEVNAEDNQGNTPLHRIGSVETVELLIDKGANIQVKNNEGNTPLYMALQNKQSEIAQLLLDKGANIQVKNNNADTPLHIAVLNNQISSIKILLSKGVKADIENAAGKTPLQLAKDTKNEEVYALLSGEQSYQTYLRTSPLWQALKAGDRNKAKAAINTGADTTYRNYAGKNTQDLLQDIRYANWEDFLKNRPFYVTESVVQIGHTYAVDTIVLLPNNTSYLSASIDRTVKHWDITTGKEIKTFVGASTPILLLPDNTSFLSAGEGGVKHWDINTGKEIKTFKVHDRSVTQILLLPDNKSFLSVADFSIKQWDIATGKEIRTFERVSDPILLPDNKSFLSISLDKTIKHWDITTGKEIKTFKGHTEYINQILLSPDGNTFLSVSSDETIKHWAINTGKEINTFDIYIPVGGYGQSFFLPDSESLLETNEYGTILNVSHGRVKQWSITTGKEMDVFTNKLLLIRKIFLLPDNKSFLSAGEDGTVKYWDIATGKEIETFVGDKGFITQFFSLPDNKTFLSANTDGIIKYCDLATGKEIKTFIGHKGYITQLLLLSDNKSFLSAGEDGTVKYWDIATGKEIKTFAGHTSSINQTLRLPDSQSFLSVGSDGTVKQWDTVTGKDLNTFAGHTDDITQITLLSDNQTFLTSSEDKTIKHWDIASGKEIKTFVGHKDDNSKITLLSDNKTFLTTVDGYSATKDFTIKHWDIASGKEIKTFVGHKDDNSKITLLADNKTFLTVVTKYSANNDFTIKHWDIASGKEIKTFTGHTEIVSQIFILPDNKTFLSSSEYGDVKHWDISTGKEIHAFGKYNEGHSEVILLPDGKTFLKSNKSGAIEHWDITSGKKIKTLEGHTASVYDLFLLPNNTSFLSASYDGTVRHWNLATGKELKRFAITYTENTRGMTLLPDGKTFLTGSSIIKHWDLTTGKEIGVFYPNHGDAKSIKLIPNKNQFMTINTQNSLTFWDIKDYKEICTLIPVAGNNKDYVITTPDGRFDGTAAGMDKLIHFVAGNEIIELDQLKDRYYEPGLWKKLLSYSGDPLRSIDKFDKVKLYPKINLGQIKPEQPLLEIKLVNRGGGIGKVPVYINNKEAFADARVFALSVPDTLHPEIQQAWKRVELERLSQKDSILIQVDLKDHYLIQPGVANLIEVKAYHEENWLVSRAVSLEFEAPKDWKPRILKRGEEDKGTNQTSPQKSEDIELEDEDLFSEPSLYVLCIGVSQYANPGINLDFSSKDAADMQNALQIAGKPFFEFEEKNKVFTYLLNSEQTDPQKKPNKANILATFQEIRKKVRHKDVVVVYLAGHGINWGGQDGDFYFLTQEAQSFKFEDPSILANSTISSRELTDLLNGFRAKKQLLILDACHSGRAIENLTSKRDLESSTVRALDKMKDRSGLHIISGCTSGQSSHEASQYGQGILTYTLLSGIKGASLYEGQFLNVLQWFNYARERVPELAGNLGGVQEPRVFSPYGQEDFSIGRLTEKEKELIPLAKAKPLFLSSKLHDAQIFSDHLGLEKLLDDEMRDIASRGKSASLVFLNSKDFPDAYFLAGKYEVNGNKVTLTANIFKGKSSEPITSLNLEGQKNALEDFAKDIAYEIEKVMRGVR